MNVQDMLADRQAALLQSRRQISIGRNPNEGNATTGPQQLPTPLINTNQVAAHRPLATRAAPPPPYINNQANHNVHLGVELPANLQPTSTEPSATENAAVGVPVSANRGLPFKGPLGPNGKPLVQPQPGSKEDLRRRKAIKEEGERIEAAKRAQAENQIAQATSPASWYTASSNTVASPSQQAQAQRAAGSSLSPPSGSNSSNSQRSALSFAVKRTPAHLVVPARSGSASGSCDSAGSGSSGERRRTSYSTLVTVPQGRQPGLIVEEDEDDLKTPTPPEIKLEKERALAAMFAASGIGAGPAIVDERTRSFDDGDDSETGEIKAAVIVRRSNDPGASQQQQSSGTGDKTGEPRLRTSTETAGSRESMTMTNTDTDGSLKTPTTAEFRNRDQAGITTGLDDNHKSGENDSNVSIPTIISSSADEEIPRKDSNNSDFHAFIKGFPGNLGQKARIVSDMGRRLSGMINKGDSSAPSTPGGSRRPSISSSVAASEMDGDGMPRNAMGRAVHRDLWKPDHLSTHCDFISCHTEFNLRVRKHHCRYCGGIFCDIHSAYSLPLYYPPVEYDDEDSRSNQASAINLTALATRFTGGVARSRVCATCFEKVAHPEKLLARRAAAKGVKTRPLVLHNDTDLPSTDEEDSDDSDDDGDGGKETFEEYQARKQQRKASSAAMNRAPPRRMFSAPATPLSRSPPKPSADNYVINSANVSPKASFRQAKPRVRTTTGSRAQSRSGTTLSRQASLSSAARKVFSPTVEAMNPNSCSPAEGPNRNSYFPVMPPPGMAHLPGEEPSTTVTGILATYPLAHKPVTSPSSPYTPQLYSQSSLLSLGSLAGPGRPLNESSSRDSSRSGSRNRLTIQNMPPLGMGPLEQIHQKLQSIGHNGTSTNTNSSAGPLTPDREWVPSAWGYDRETFDPDRELDDDEEMKRGRTKLVVDGDFRFKANPLAVDEAEEANDIARDEQQRFSTSLTWATF